MTDNIVGQLRTAAIMQRHEEVYCPDLLRKAAAEIERLRMMGDRLVNAVYFLLDGAEPAEDLAGVLAVWERASDG